MKDVYIHAVDILESVKDKETVFKGLLNKGIEIADRYNAEKIMLGIRDKEILSIAESLGYNSSYAAYNMLLDNKEKRYETLDIVPLSDKNILEYIDVFNKSFMDMPHGTYIDIDEAREYIKETDHNNKFFMVSADENNIGFVNITINNDEGFFDIGLCKEYRGQGYGKRLLETAIQLLEASNVEKICLTVIEKNKIAFDMYQKRGFRIYKTLSKWIKLK